MDTNGRCPRQRGAGGDTGLASRARPDEIIVFSWASFSRRNIYIPVPPYNFVARGLQPMNLQIFSSAALPSPRIYSYFHRLMKPTNIYLLFSWASPRIYFGPRKKYIFPIVICVINNLDYMSWEEYGPAYLLR